MQSKKDKPRHRKTKSVKSPKKEPQDKDSKKVEKTPSKRTKKVEAPQKQQEEKKTLPRRIEQKVDIGLELETQLKVEGFEELSDMAIITLGGFLQRRESKAILKVVETLEAGGTSKIIFDMESVKYANSSAIGAFVNSASSLKASGGEIVLLGMRPNIEKVFQTLGLTALFVIATTEEEALKAVSA